MMTKLCPCTSGEAYSLCCQPYHRGKRPFTPTLLMRSRFAAFSLGKVGYIMQTQRLDTPSNREELHQFCEQTDFVGLQILAETANSVTFHAVLLQNGRDASFTERSLFEKQRGRWLYVGALPLEAETG